MEETTATVSQVENSDLKKLQETVTSIVLENPEDAALLIRSWFLESNYKAMDRAKQTDANVEYFARELNIELKATKEEKKYPKDYYTGYEKAAIFLITIGSEVSLRIFKYLREIEISILADVIARYNIIEPDQKETTLQEFYKRIMSHQFTSVGGIDYARELVAKSFGSQEGDDFFEHYKATERTQPFNFIQYINPAYLSLFIQSEHPQTIALILTYLEPRKAAVILESLSSDMQSEVSRRIATMNSISPKILRGVAAVLNKKLSTLPMGEYPTSGGIKNIVKIINRVNRASRKQIVEDLKNIAIFGEDELGNITMEKTNG